MSYLVKIEDGNGKSDYSPEERIYTESVWGSRERAEKRAMVIRRQYDAANWTALVWVEAI